MIVPNRGYYTKGRDPVDVYLSYTRRPARKDKFSKFRGVHKHADPRKPFRVAIRYNGKRYFIGTFADELEAAKAYNEIALRLFGSRAVLNEIPPCN